MPVPPAEYLERKSAELRCLSEFIRDRRKKEIFRKELRLDGYDDVHRAKMLVRDAISASQSTLRHGESNLAGSNRPLEHHGFRLNYYYQRFDLTMLSTDHLAEIYPGLRAPRGAETFGAFTSSGQSAISIGLDVLEDLDPAMGYSLPGGAYFETIDRLGIRGGATAPSASPKNRALFLDSSTQSWEDGPKLRAAISEAALVLADTTCLPLNSSALADVVRIAAARGKAVILFRSHIKLDCLATEYARLGSIVVIEPKRSRSRRERFLHRFEARFTLRCRLYCGFPTVRQIYPFHKSARFQRLSRDWIENLRLRNDEVVAPLLEEWSGKDAPFRLQRFDHGLYFWIKFNVPVRKEKFLKLQRFLAKCMAWAGIPSKASPSYPWDFLSITHMRTGQRFSPNEREAYPITRISAPDFDSKISADISYAIDQWLRYIRKNV
jgi:hypothetical protein